MELFTAQIINSTRPGDIVLDLFTGSGIGAQKAQLVTEENTENMQENDEE